MVYLDTNTLYYACGISTNAPCDTIRLREIIKNNHVAISIATMYEFVLKWRNDISKIHIIGKFLGDNHIKVVGNPYYQFPNKCPIEWDVISEQDKENFIQLIMPTKIDVEARLSSIVFSVCFISIAYFMVEDDSQNGVSDFYTNALRSIMEMMNDVDIDVFKRILEEGYATDDCENYLRKSFDNYMEFWLQTFVPILKKANEVESYEEYVELEKQTDWNVLSSRLSKKINKSQTTLGFIKKRAQQHWKSIGDDHLGEFLNMLRKSINKKISHESMQEYLTEMLKNILLNGSSFWKNDIIDAIIMCHIRNEGDILITFDQGALNHMKTHREEHTIYNASLQMIKRLKK